ncbi:EthD family reductase [Nocardia sp. BMG51109]|uniref:EthD family reductase n=1 Tax=Nocardia sp. BMG51109 TaxID=1056816 RepID=UPI000465200C|nr:EthD family reductase [Nocardia sp. BMG51109]
MYRLTILYGHPDDPAQFDDYYWNVHIPIAKKMVGLKKWTLGKGESIERGTPAPYYLVVGLYADTREDLERILATPEGQAAVADVPNFATGGVTFVYSNEQDVIDPQ